MVLATPVPTHAELAVRVVRAGKHCFARTPSHEHRRRRGGDRGGRGVPPDADGRAPARVPPAVVQPARDPARGRAGLAVLHRLEPAEPRPAAGRRERPLEPRRTRCLSRAGPADEDPQTCLADGRSFVRAGVEDVVFCNLAFPSGVFAHLHLSWFDPHKERRLTVVGSQRMATFDDMLLEGKLTVYDKGFDEDASSWGVRGARPRGRELLSTPLGRRAAASGVRALHRVPARGVGAAQRRLERAAGRACAGGAPALAR